MDFASLKDYLQHRMRMSHIYQPVMIRTLLSHKGPATARDIATQFIPYDLSQIEYYEAITKRMPAVVLQKNGIIRRSKWGYELAFEDNNLTAKERDELIAICNTRLDEYLTRRGERVWQHRHPGTSYISGSERYEVLKRAGFRCQLCGISAEERRLDVDHIIPRILGGPSTLDNYQALCYICNENKNAKDQTDFRNWVHLYEKRQTGCIFCSPPKENILDETELAFVFKDNFAVTPYHSLVIPRRHVGSMFDLFVPEVSACIRLLNKWQHRIQEKDPAVSGFNVGINIGEAAGQSVMHCHWHLIPRRIGDVPNPRGGIRHIIPGKGNYEVDNRVTLK
jgi:ATP adenylyltransferase